MPSQTDQLDDLLTIPEAAEQLQMSEREVRDLLQDGALRGAKVGGRWVTTVAAVQELEDDLDAEEEEEDDGDDDDDDDEDA